MMFDSGFSSFMSFALCNHSQTLSLSPSLQRCDQWCHNLSVSTGKVPHCLPGVTLNDWGKSSLCETVKYVSPSGQQWEKLSHLLWDPGRTSLATEAGILSARRWDLLLSQPGRMTECILNTTLLRILWHQYWACCHGTFCLHSGRGLWDTRKEWYRGLPASACCHGEPPLHSRRPVGHL